MTAAALPPSFLSPSEVPRRVSLLVADAVNSEESDQTGNRRLKDPAGLCSTEGRRAAPQRRRLRWLPCPPRSTFGSRESSMGASLTICSMNGSRGTRATWQTSRSCRVGSRDSTNSQRARPAPQTVSEAHARRCEDGFSPATCWSRLPPQSGLGPAPGKPVGRQVSRSLFPQPQRGREEFGELSRFSVFPPVCLINRQNAPRSRTPRPTGHFSGPLFTYRRHRGASHTPRPDANLRSAARGRRGHGGGGPRRVR